VKEDRVNHVRSGRRRLVAAVLLAVAVAVVATVAGTGTTRAASSADWPGYLYSTSHSSYNAAATAITPANAHTLKRVWIFKPDAPAVKSLGGFYASPAVRDGVVYIGGRNGYFYAINEATGALIWKRFIGYVPGLTCGAEGFTSTATVAPDPTTGDATVYVYGATGYLYALNAANGTNVWPPAVVAIPSTTKSDYYAWSSPLVLDGHIYLGVSSGCDRPLIRGALVQYSQTDGSLDGTYYTTPSGTVGASIWSSPATDGASVFATTGNGKASSVGYSILRVDPTSMTLADSWAVPAAQRIVDSDFGGSPTMFSANPSGSPVEMVGACNKNGLYYAFNAGDLAAGPVWTLKVGDPNAGECDAAAIWDGTALDIAGPGTTIGSVAYGGSISQVNPTTGAPVWQTGLIGPVVGSPSEDGAGVIAAATFGSTTGSNAVYLLSASSGAVLKMISTGTATVFAQPVFADGYLLVAGRSGGLKAFAPS
jgi:outer membrane protein assembly factor BamB